MPYSQPARSASRSVSPPSYRDQNYNPSGHSLGRPGHRRSYSSQAHLEFGSESSSNSGISARSPSPTRNSRFTNEGFANRGAWGSLGALPRRHSSAIPTINTSKFHIGDKNENSSSDDENVKSPSLKLQVQVMPSYSEGVPFPKSSTDVSPVSTGPMHINSPAHVVMTRPSAVRTASSPAVIPPAPPPTATGGPAVVLLSNGKPLRSSLKGSRVSSLLNSPMGSATPSPSTSPRTSPVNSTTNSVETSPITSPGIPGFTAPSLNGILRDPTLTFLVPPALSGHIRAQSVPSPPSTAYPSPAPTPLGPFSPSIPSPLATDTPLSPGLSEPPMSPGLLSPRNVHFPSLPSDLERVRIFRKEARPSSLLVTRKEHAQLASKGETRADDRKNIGEETDTETETDKDSGFTNGYLGAWGGRGLWGAVATSPGTKNRASVATDANAAFPFPRLPKLGRARSPGNKAGADDDEGSSSGSGSPAGTYSRIRKTGTGPRFASATEDDTLRGCKIELDMPSSEYPVPRPESVRDALAGSTSIFLDELHLEPSDGTKPLVLAGSFLVRNVTFEKQVHARFTTDNWGTVNEVRGRWAGSCGRSYLTSLVSRPAPRTFGDIIALPSYADTVLENTSEWDRFAFDISLPPAIGPGRVVEFVGRFTAGVAGGEWWDNCGGKNWRIGFRKVDNVQGATDTKASPSTPETTEAISPISVDIPVPVFDMPVSPTATSASRDNAIIINSVVPTEYEVKEGSTLQTLQNTEAEDDRKGSDRREVFSPKERAPKPTGLGSLNGLGALFWPRKSPSPPVAEIKSAFSSSSSSGSDSSDASRDPLSLNSLASVTTSVTTSAPSLAASGSSSPKMSPAVAGDSPRNLPASATVEILSIIPPAANSPGRQSLNVKVPSSPPRSSTITASIPEHQHERLSSVSSSSSISSFDSMELPLLERSSSLSSMSTDGDDIELTGLLHGGASGANPFSKRRLGSELDLTPMPNDSHPVTVGEGGFFDRSGPGTGGGGIVAPMSSGKALDADPLYKAFIQQWCFAGTGPDTGSVQGKVKSSPSHRNGLQVR
ncbi:hypothetical protein BDP27DRAFT_1420325 [Rhodocollybia butyracea]|uniref:CBM21 domain-containing protein n=1 Tax=Rhodocollybia butyracea TaxID=206335 RepID=A0A9P5PX36_9AGAR|nr:hypothetical protein BDP27DRAFT_1420325 [Rhodocollybia butyracea]